MPREGSCGGCLISPSPGAKFLGYWPPLPRVGCFLGRPCRHALPMSNHHFYACILAGGSGERFWPMSRVSLPKHLLKLLSDTTLLEQTARRLEGVVPPENIFVLTNEAQLAGVRAALPLVPPAQVIAEPARRDTAPAAALATALVRARDPEGVVALLPADAFIRDERCFAAQLAAALVWASRSEGLLTFAVTPSHPATGFGYLELGEEIGREPEGGRFRRVRRFVEKPDAATAARYLASGDYAWNAGLFVWRVGAFLAEADRQAPALAAFVREFPSGDAGAYLAARFPALPRISVDYAIMEKALAVATLVAEFDWDDVGTWTALRSHFPADASGNAVRGPVVAVDSTGNVAISNGRVIALCGVKDLVVVETPERGPRLPPGRRAGDQAAPAALAARSALAGLVRRAPPNSPMPPLRARYDAIYLAPHLDDAVLSCGGTVAAQVRRGESILIATIAAGDPPPGPLSAFAESMHASWKLGRDAVERRRDEDRGACGLLGVDWAHFPIPECLYRPARAPGTWRYACRADIFGSLHPEDEGLVAEIASLLAGLPPAARIGVPLGVGGHVDHQLVRRAAERAGIAGAFYYAEQPYSARDPAPLAARRARPDWREERVRLADEELTAKLAAARAYASQVAKLYPEGFGEGSPGRASLRGESFWRKVPEAPSRNQ